jgi:hypothetical protein
MLAPTHTKGKQMNVEKLKTLGKKAYELRYESHNKQSDDYKKVIEAIDKEVEILKRFHPQRFIDPLSDEYKALVAKWDAYRERNNKISGFLKEVA